MRALMICALLLSSGQASLAQEGGAKRLVVMLDGTLDTARVVGAGVIVGIGHDRLYIATAYHVVHSGPKQAKDLKVQVEWLPGEWFPAELLGGADKDLDLAVLVAKGARDLAVPDLHWKILGSPADLNPRDEVFPVGYPSGTPWFVSVQPHLVSGVDAQVVKTEGNLVPGNSGGALFTKDWRMVGLVSSTGALLGESTRIDVVVDRLKAWGYPVQVELGEVKPSPSPPGVPKPDLRVAQYRFAQRSDSVLEVEIANDGGADAGPAVLRLTINKIRGATVGRTTEVPLRGVPMETTIWTSVDALRLLPSGVALRGTAFTLNVDSANAVDESDESNNASRYAPRQIPIPTIRR
jgi:hypothetical protein